MTETETRVTCAFAGELLMRGLQVRIDPRKRMLFMCWVATDGGFHTDQLAVHSVMAFADLAKFAEAYAVRLAGSAPGVA